jgi:hypothetical protein
VIKIVTVILLVANLALFLLIRDQADQERARRPVPGGNIQLLSEYRAQQLPREPATAPAPSKAVAKPKAETPHCYSYGPLSSRLAAVGVLARFKELSITPAIREVPPGKRYWVLVGPGESPGSLGEALRSGGLANAREITHGDRKGQFLLGILSDKARAEKLATTVPQGAGKALVSEEAADGAQFWVDFSSPNGGLDPRALGLLSTKTYLLKGGCQDSR